MTNELCSPRCEEVSVKTENGGMEMVSFDPLLFVKTTYWNMRFSGCHGCRHDQYNDKPSLKYRMPVNQRHMYHDGKRIEPVKIQSLQFH